MVVKLTYALSKSSYHSQMDPIHIRETRNFALLYNAISEDCFNRCVSNLHQRAVRETESSCVDACVAKHMNVNHATMLVYAELQPHYLQQRLEQVEQQQQQATLLMQQQQLEQQQQQQ